MLAVLLALIVGQTQIQIPPRDASARSAPAATISGRITEMGSGLPIARAMVTLAKTDRSWQLETVGDDDGRYEFAGVDPGQYIMWAGPPEMRATHLRQVFGRIPDSSWSTCALHES